MAEFYCLSDLIHEIRQDSTQALHRVSNSKTNNRKVGNVLGKTIVNYLKPRQPKKTIFIKKL